MIISRILTLKKKHVINVKNINKIFQFWGWLLFPQSFEQPHRKSSITSTAYCSGTTQV